MTEDSPKIVSLETSLELSEFPSEFASEFPADADFPSEAAPSTGVLVTGACAAACGGDDQRIG